MIVVKLIGGLGNQLFQYALGRALAEKHHTPLFLDKLGFREYKLHKYSLANFAITQKFLPEGFLRYFFPKNKIIRLFNRLRGKLLPYWWQRVICEPCFHFDPNILRAPANVYLDGYWQSEKYFQNVIHCLRQELQVKTPPSGLDRELIEHMANSNSVAVHIRRGDYVSNPETLKTHGLCSMEYYYRGIELVSKKNFNPTLFIFSDDPNWAKMNIHFPYKQIFVSHNSAEKNYEDLRLMSSCKHFVIANSSFSWWGAWLGSFPQKTVVAPEKWFERSERNAKDIYLPDWIKM